MIVAVITGGTSSERDVALLSAQTVQRALQGRVQTRWYDLPTDMQRLIVEKGEIDCAVPVFHGRGGESGEIQGFLRVLGIPFVFSDVAAHAVGIDKALTKTHVQAYGYSTPDWVVLGPDDVHEFLGPVVVKPLDGGSSLGIQLVFSKEEMKQALDLARKETGRVLVERQVQGREFTVTVVEHEGVLQALPVIEIRSKNTFFDYESKYDASLAEEICPAEINEELAQQLSEMTLAVHEMIGARHLSRSDMIVDEEGEIWFLEINTIPGLTSNSLAPKSIRAAGLDIGDLLEQWIRSSL